jgi:hypothetical protein
MVMPIVLVPHAPRLIVKLAGVSESEKPAACGVALTWVELALSPLAFTALTTKNNVVPFVKPVFVNAAVVELPTVVYGPPLVVARFTL